MRTLIWIIVAAVVALAVVFFSQPTTQDDVSAPAVGEESAAAPAGPEPTIGLIDDDRINAAAAEPGNWLAYGRT
ncbi:MAG TPA: hypothetical protein VIS76_15140, partial [Pseudomonadales bacterium]